MSNFLWPIVIFSCLLPAQDPPLPAFPSDSKPLVQAADHELIEAVFPGHEEKGGRVGCAKTCPSFTGFPNSGDFDWLLERVTRGHFQSPLSDDAVVATSGCESHALNFGGTILTKQAAHWKMIWYKAGIETDRCHKVPLANAREILVCVAQAGGQGYVSTSLYVKDILKADSETPALLSITDSSETCAFVEDKTRPVPLTRAYIDKVEFGPSTMTVTASFGSRLIRYDRAKVCLEEQQKDKPRSLEFVPAVRSYRVDFTFDGHTFKLTPASAAAAKILQAQ